MNHMPQPREGYYMTNCVFCNTPMLTNQGLTFLNSQKHIYDFNYTMYSETCYMFNKLPIEKQIFYRLKGIV